MQHLASLLASPYPEVCEAALQTLVSFIKKTHHANVRWHGHKELSSRLTAMSQGWGGKEEVSALRFWVVNDGILISGLSDLQLCLPGPGLGAHSLRGR